MTQAIPEKVKASPILKKIWHDIYSEEMNFTCLVCGQTGRGKSTVAIRLCELLDSSFNIERVVFTSSELMDLINKGDSQGRLNRGSAVIFDEAAGSSDAADARNSMSNPNKILSYFATIGRQKGLIVFYISPQLAQLDKRLRLVGIHAVLSMESINRAENTSRGTFYWCYPSRFSNKLIMPRPRVQDFANKTTYCIPYVEFTLPENKELLKAYSQKKTDFINRQVKEWSEQLTERKNQKKGNKATDLNALVAKASKDLFSLKDNKDRFSVPRIRSKLNVGMDTAKAIKTLLIAQSGQNTPKNEDVSTA